MNGKGAEGADRSPYNKSKTRNFDKVAVTDVAGAPRVGANKPPVLRKTSTMTRSPKSKIISSGNSRNNNLGGRGGLGKRLANQTDADDNPQSNTGGYTSPPTSRKHH